MDGTKTPEEWADVLIAETDDEVALSIEAGLIEQTDNGPHGEEWTNRDGGAIQ